MFKEYLQHDATGLAELIARGEVSAGEVLEAALARAAKVDPQLASICIPMDAIARQRAQSALRGPFAGVPFLLKDIGQDYAGVPSTSGSRALRHWVPQRHAEIVQRFLDAGLVVFGKTAAPEFALRAETAPRIWDQPTRNPWDQTRTPGGSSGGSAAAVAAGIVPAAGASDGGGSIRIPASCCGLFGLRPSRGRVSSGRDQGEVWDGASSQHVLSRSVRDSARMLDAIAGPCSGDPFIIIAPEQPFADVIARPPRPLRIGYCTDSPLGTSVHAECVHAVLHAAKLLSGLGHTVEPAAPAYDGHALARSYISMYFGQTAASVARARHSPAPTTARSNWRHAFSPCSAARSVPATTQTNGGAGTTTLVRWETSTRLTTCISRRPPRSRQTASANWPRHPRNASPPVWCWPCTPAACC